MKKFHYAAAVTSLVVGILFLFGTAPFWWIGSGFIAAGGATIAWRARPEIGRLVEWLKTPRTVWGFEIKPSTVLAEVACILVIATITTVMMPKVALGDRPVDHDHTVHYMKAWQLFHDFLAEGYLYGWSNAWFSGYPAQYLYPIGADLLVCFVHIATFGLIDFSSAYAWAIWIFWFLGGYVLYRFGANSFGRWAGLLAGFWFMTDTAGQRIGGWNYSMTWGVWPMSLGVVLGTWAMAKVPKLVDGVSWRDVAAFAAVVAAALLTHPYMMIYFAVTFTVALVAYWLSESDRHWLAGAVRMSVGAAAGVLVACLWIVPFMSSEAFMDPHFGGRWTSMFKMGRGFYDLDIFPGTWGLITALGLVGTVALLWSRKFTNLLIGLLTITFIVFGSTDFLASMNWFDYFGSFQRVHFKRFIWLLKPYWMLAAVFPVVAVVRYTADQASTFFAQSEQGEGGHDGQPAFRRWFRVTLVILCLTPLAVPFFNHYGSKNIKHKITNESERPHQRSRRRLVRWFEKKYPDGEPFFRVGLNMFRHDHSFVDLGARFPFPLYKMGYTPATSYDFRMEGNSEELMQAVNIRYVVSKGGPPPGNFNRVAKFGALNLYEYRDWQKAPFKVIEGSGKVTLESFETEKLVFRAHEGAEGRLRLSLSNFSRWHAYRDGEEIPIGQTKVKDHENTGFMTLELKPGKYRVVFERGWAEPMAFLLFLVGLLLIAGFLLADTELAVGRRIRGWIEPVEDWIDETCESYEQELEIAGTAALMLGVVAVVGMAWSWPAFDVKHHEELKEAVADVNYDFGDQLRYGRVEIRQSDNSTRTCRPMLGRFLCGSQAWKVVHQRVEDMGQEVSLARCIWAHPQPEGPVEISFADVPSGDAIVGFYGVPESGSATNKKPVNFKVALGGRYRFEGEITDNKQVKSFKVPIPENKRGGTIDVRFQVSAPHTGQRHFCFNGQVAEMVEGVEFDSSEDAGE